MKLSDLADALGLSLNGDGDHHVDKLAPLDRATPSDLTFIVSGRYRNALSSCRAGAIIVPASLSDQVRGNYLVSDNPYASYAKASWLLAPDFEAHVGIAATAFIHPSATVDATASVAEHAVVEADAKIGPNAVIGAHCVIGKGVSIGADSRLFARVTVYHGCTLGESCRVQSGAVIGSEGFGYAHENGWLPIHQTGAVVVGNKVHIGANTTIDRGAMDDTVIADGVILDNQIQIAHNVRIGENTAIAACVGIAGSTRIGANCQIGGACNIIGHLNIVDSVVLTPTSYVTQSIESRGRYSSGMPLQTTAKWKRSFVLLSRLNELLDRVRRLEKGSDG